MGDWEVMIKAHDEIPDTEPRQDNILRSVMNKMPAPLLSYLQLNSKFYPTAKSAKEAMMPFLKNRRSSSPEAIGKDMDVNTFLKEVQVQ